LKLLDDPGVISFDGNTTYKRINSKMNEWELTIIVKIASAAGVAPHPEGRRLSSNVALLNCLDSLVDLL
jgi:hypothetical protein